MFTNLGKHPDKGFVHPQGRWECGREGMPCRYGPTFWGRCCMRAECEPVRKGDRWRCTRPAARGGPCAGGPLPDGSCCHPPEPCLPRSTPRRLFGIVWRLSLCFSFALAALILYTKADLSPGRLASVHASFENDCALCHANFADSLIGWLDRAVADKDPMDAMVSSTVAADGVEAMAGSDSTLDLSCLKCHRQGRTGFLVHGVNIDKLRTVSERARTIGAERPLAARLPRMLAARSMEEGWIRCLACHREHEGRDNRTVALTDGQCQVCHVDQFDGYAEHPAFIAYPHQLAGRIQFSHERHFRLHFPDQAGKGVEPPSGCHACHRSDVEGNMFVNDGFAACAACHEDQVAGDEDANFLAFLSPPGLDVEALADHRIGQWPEYAEDEPGPFLMLVLEAGGYLEEGDAALLAETDLYDLGDADGEELLAAARFAWAVKSMMHDLVERGPDVFVDAARRLHGDNPADEPAWTDLVASMPYPVVRAAVGQWYPNLAAELDARGGGAAPATEMLDPGFEPAPDGWSDNGGWLAGDLSLNYLPTGHADRFLRGWMAFASAPTPGARKLFELLAHEDAPGNCAKCHVAGEGERRELHWKAAGSETTQPYADSARASGRDQSLWRRIKPFSHFSHQHAIAQGGCQSCHEPAKPTGFALVDAKDCGGCHNPQNDLASCTTCHNYHFRIFDDEMHRDGGKFAASGP